MRCFFIFLLLVCIGLLANGSYAPSINGPILSTNHQKKTVATHAIEFQYAATNDFINDHDDFLQSAEDDDEECSTDKRGPTVREGSIPLSTLDYQSPHPSTDYSLEGKLSYGAPLHYLKQRSLRI
ncbi:MAG: hypothetical protein ACXVBF_12325 [Flavisolibacter sp.]